jgi:hypothetical protein
MRFSISSILAVASLAIAPGLHADLVGDLDFSLDNGGIGSGYSTSTGPDADCYSVPQANCVLFTGTLTDLDNDPAAFLFFDQFPAGIQVVFSNSPASGSLTLDNTFYNVVPGLLSGDPDWAADGFPADTYSGPIFGIEIAPNTSPGIYSGTVTIGASGGDDDPNGNGFTVQENFTVDVLSPEPGAFTLLFAGLLPLVGWLTMKRKWRSPASSR